MSASPSWTDWLPSANAGMGIYRGATSGNPVGQTRAGLGAANLYGRLTGNSALHTGATGALDALGIYQGLEQGGWQGDARASASGLQLAGLASGSSALGTAGGALLVPLDLANEVQSWKSGATGSDALSGAETGAALGSIIPGVGTLIGGALGGAAGAISSAFGGGEVDPENQSFNQYVNSYNQAQKTNQSGAQVAAGDQDPYLALAGYYDLRPGQVDPNDKIYSTYGRMGEQQFTNDLASKINAPFESGQFQAGPNGTITAKLPNGGTTTYNTAQDAAQAIYGQDVQPWLNSMGNFAGPNSGAMDQLVQQMTSQYLGGQASQDWRSIGGQNTFANLYGQPAPQPLHAKTGGSVPTSELQAKLKKLYEGSFAQRKTHFSDGGGADYLSYFTPSAPDSPMTGPTPIQDLSGSIGNDLNPDNPFSSLAGLSTANGQVLNAQNDPTGYSGSGTTNGALSALGVSSMGQLVQKYGALAPLIAAALGGGNKPASAPATPAGYGAIPSIATPNYSRPYTQPNVANWYTYGEGPEQSFFGNNQLPYVPGVSPQSAAPGATSPGGGSPPAQPTPSPNAGFQPIQLPPQSRLAGGGAFDSTQGDSYVPDPGTGNGTSDDIDAKLSGGEYVVDAGTVSMLGNGSNEAGSRALDKLRIRVRKHGGKQLVKGKQFMKAKSPEAYLKGGQE